MIRPLISSVKSKAELWPSINTHKILAVMWKVCTDAHQLFAWCKHSGLLVWCTVDQSRLQVTCRFLILLQENTHHPLKNIIRKKYCCIYLQSFSAISYRDFFFLPWVSGAPLLTFIWSLCFTGIAYFSTFPNSVFSNPLE